MLQSFKKLISIYSLGFLKFWTFTHGIVCISLFRTYLKDLVETTHLFLKMLENFSKKTHLVVQKKKKKTGRKKKPRNNGKWILQLYNVFNGSG